METEKPVLGASEVLKRIQKGMPIENVSVLDKLQINSIALKRHTRVQ